MNQAETSHLESDLIAAELDVARLRAALSDGDVLANFEPPEGAPAPLIATQRKFLADQVAEHQAKLAVLDRQRAQKEAEGATIAATVVNPPQFLPFGESGQNCGSRAARPTGRKSERTPIAARSCVRTRGAPHWLLLMTKNLPKNIDT
jgi:hypothetical protein